MRELELDAMDPFEARFARRLDAYADIPVPPVDAAAVAHEVLGRTRRRWGIGRGAVGVPAVAWVLLALATAAAAALVAGALLHARDPGLPMVLATETGLYLAADDGGGPRLLRDDGSWIDPRWSPSGDRIAVLHGPPIPPQAGAHGGLPNTPAQFTLESTEVVVLDPAGSVRYRVPGAAIGARWAPPGPDGTSLLAVRHADGSVAVAGPDGRLLDIGFPADEAWREVDAPLLRPGLAWAGPRILLAVRGQEVLRLDLDAPADMAPVASALGGRINDIALSGDGRSLALVVGACRLGCTAEARIVRLEPGPPSSSVAPPAGRPAGSGVDAATALSWTAADDRLLAWPLYLAAGDAAALPVVMPPVLENRDVVPGLARLAPDGSGRIIALNQYSFYNDRHFDAWVVRPDGTATRVAQRSLGFDIRPGPGGPATP